MVRSHTVKLRSHLEPKKVCRWVVGGRPNLMLAQVQVFCPGSGQGQDLTGNGPGLDLDWTWTGPGPDLGPGMGPGPELDNNIIS